MKRFFALISSIALLAGFVSCETYRVADPDMTAIHLVDGKYMAFATPQGQSEPTTILAIGITNTTDNAKDAGWITITDMDYSYTGTWQRLFAVRFKISINADAQTFSASAAEVIEPMTAWNPYIEGAYGSYGSYYTATRQWPARFNLSATATITNGKVVTDGVTTPSTYKADLIEFTYTLTNKDGSSKTYAVKGQKKTGWGEDAIEYEEWLAKKGWW